MSFQIRAERERLDVRRYRPVGVRSRAGQFGHALCLRLGPGGGAGGGDCVGAQVTCIWAQGNTRFVRAPLPAHGAQQRLGRAGRSLDRGSFSNPIILVLKDLFMFMLPGRLHHRSRWRAGGPPYGR